jgi:hypothetical protein
LAEPCPAEEVFQRGPRDAGLLCARAKAARSVRAQVDPDGLVLGAPEISMAGQPVSHWPLALALPVDSPARREATDSNSVWEAPAPTSCLRADAQPQQASLTRAQQKLHGELRRERLRAPSRRQELAVAPEEQADAPAA